MPPARTLSAGRYLLILDGQEAGYLNSVDGGTARADVIQQHIGADVYAKKSLGPPYYEPIVLSFGASMGGGMFDWIRSSLLGSYQFKNGEIVAIDFNNKALQRLKFHRAVISSLTIPALDGSSKDAAYFTLTLQPETTELLSGDGSKLKVTVGKKSKKWLASNFRVELGGLPCDRVSSIESFTINFTAAGEARGEYRDYENVRVSLQIPDLLVTISAADADPWQAWFKSFVIDGNCTDADELTGSITFLAPDIKTELGHIELLNVGIFALKPAAASKDEIARFKVALYCENMIFEFNSP